MSTKIYSYNNCTTKLTFKQHNLEKFNIKGGFYV